jgi:hypothetical protein
LRNGGAECDVGVVRTGEDEADALGDEGKDHEAVAAILRPLVAAIVVGKAEQLLKMGPDMRTDRRFCLACAAEADEAGLMTEDDGETRMRSLDATDLVNHLADCFTGIIIVDASSSLLSPLLLKLSRSMSSLSRRTTISLDLSTIAERFERLETCCVCCCSREADDAEPTD